MAEGASSAAGEGLASGKGKVTDADATAVAGKAATAGSNKWTTRDVLTFVAFNVIIIVATTVVKMLGDLVISPTNAFFVNSLLFPVVVTPFYLVMADRIAKRGVLAGTVLVFGILYTFMGGLYCLPVAVVGAVVGELAMWGRGAYHDVKRLVGGFYVYWITVGLYGVIPYTLFAEAYKEQLSAYYSAADVAAMAAQYTELPWILLMLALFAVGTVIGGLIGSKFLKKHVRKAKIA